MSRLGRGSWCNNGAPRSVGGLPDASAASQCVPEGPRWWAVGSYICRPRFPETRRSPDWRRQHRRGSSGASAAAAHRVLAAADAPMPVPDPAAPKPIPAGFALRFEAVRCPHDVTEADLRNRSTAQALPAGPERSLNRALMRRLPKVGIARGVGGAAARQTKYHTSGPTRADRSVI